MVTKDCTRSRITFNIIYFVFFAGAGAGAAAAVIVVVGVEFITEVSIHIKLNDRRHACSKSDT